MDVDMPMTTPLPAGNGGRNPGGGGRDVGNRKEGRNGIGGISAVVRSGGGDMEEFMAPRQDTGTWKENWASVARTTVSDSASNGKLADPLEDALRKHKELETAGAANEPSIIFDFKDHSLALVPALNYIKAQFPELNAAIVLGNQKVEAHFPSIAARDAALTRKLVLEGKPVPSVKPFQTDPGMVAIRVANYSNVGLFDKLVQEITRVFARSSQSFHKFTKEPSYVVRVQLSCCRASAKKAKRVISWKYQGT